MPRSEDDELKRLVNVASFFSLPNAVGTTAPGAADHRRYTITIEDEGKQHSVHLSDPVEDPHLQALLTFLKTRGSSAT